MPRPYWTSVGQKKNPLAYSLSNVGRASANMRAHNSSNQVKRTVAMGDARSFRGHKIGWPCSGEIVQSPIFRLSRLLIRAQQTETRLGDCQQKMCALASAPCAAGEHCHFARCTAQNGGWGRNTNSIFLSNRAHTTSCSTTLPYYVRDTNHGRRAAFLFGFVVQIL